MEAEYGWELVHPIPVRHGVQILGFADCDLDPDVHEGRFPVDIDFFDGISTQDRDVGTLVQIIPIDGRGEVVP